MTPETITPPGRRTSARERLLEAANRLFYSEGVHSVGIDRILAESGVAKRSLYTNFASKEGLVEAYLQGRHRRTTDRLAAAIAGTDDPREKILAVFDVQAETFRQPDFNGCAITNAAAEHQPGDIVERATTEFRTWIAQMFLDLAVGAGAARPAQLARQLHALYDGGIASARMDHDPTVAADTRAAAQALLEAHTHPEREQT